MEKEFQNSTVAPHLVLIFASLMMKVTSYSWLKCKFYLLFFISSAALKVLPTTTTQPKVLTMATKASTTESILQNKRWQEYLSKFEKNTKNEIISKADKKAYWDSINKPALAQNAEVPEEFDFYEM